MKHQFSSLFHIRHLLILLLGTGTALLHAASPFEIPLTFENAQVDRLIIGCHTDASDGIDRKLDIFVPPFGMGTGTIGILIDDRRQDMLYKDIRSMSLPQTWSVQCIPGQKPLAVRWRPQIIPKSLSATMKRQNGARLDMRKTGLLLIAQKETLTITIDTVPASTPRQLLP